MQGDIYAMSINASSLFGQGEGRKMGLQQYARFLGGHGVEVNAVVTEMRFDTSANMKLTFSAVRPLEEAEYAMVLKRKDEKDALDAVTMTVGELDGAPAPQAPAPAAPLFSAPPAPVAAPKPTPKATPAAGGFKVSKAAPAPAEAEPVVREAKPEAPTPGAMNVNALLSQWGDDADD